jgi:elongation factor P--(R)-beta-lysine ligase
MSKQSMLWQPSCSLAMLKARAEFYAQIRAFFVERNVLEVETPILGRSTATDPHLDSLSLLLQQQPGDTREQFYLHTSPEFPMKRLLAAGSGAIFQICKTFRNSESGARHNPEFSMLEWYQPAYALDDLIEETLTLVERVIGPLIPRVLSYRDAFEEHLGIDPFTASLALLKRKSEEVAAYQGPDLLRDEYLDLLLSVGVEPKLGVSADAHCRPLVLCDYPASQASLAKLKLDAKGQQVAERFELYINGLEIANAYNELTDAVEQRHRFEQDNLSRKQLGFEPIKLDEHFLTALGAGLPQCSGIALGLDRLLMIKEKARSISEVLTFAIERA